MSDHRGIILSRSDRNRLSAVANALEQRKFARDAQTLNDIVARFDSAHGFTVLHASALAQRVEAPADEGLDEREPVADAPEPEASAI